MGAVSTLTRAEAAELERLEAIVEAGVNVFVEVGNALIRIRDARLYRATHATWQEYLDARFKKLSRSYAHRLIEAAAVRANVANWQHSSDGTGPVVPLKESQARPLVGLKPDQQRRAWEKAVESAGGQQPTAKQVEEAAEEVAGSGRDRKRPGKKSDHYTPADLVEAVLDVLSPEDRRIGLDPCAPVDPEDRAVPAREYLTHVDNALEHEWHATTVYMNPPWSGLNGGERHHRIWVDKIIEEIDKGHVDEAIVLMPATPGVAWFRALSNDHLWCALAHRPKFSGAEQGAMGDVAMFYMGNLDEQDESRFVERFRRLGPVFRCVARLEKARVVYDLPKTHPPLEGVDEPRSNSPEDLGY